MKLNLADIGRAMQAVGDYENAQDLVAAKVQTDSRLVEPGDLFVCIPGQRFDGHNFAREAVHKGALAVVVERPLLDLASEVPMLLVQDSVQALTRLAAFWRSRFQGRVVAVTGTAGKTSVKEMLASVLEQAGTTGKNYKNWNNQLGISLSVLGMHGREDYWVLEAGVSEENEMQGLASILAPDVAVLVNVGPAHLQGLKTVRGVAREKTRLVQALMPSGTAAVSMDYPELLEALPDRADIQVRTFSTRPEAGADCFLSRESGDREGKRVLSLTVDARPLTLRLRKDRPWIAENLLATVCAATCFGLEEEAIQAGLERVSLPEHRGQIRDLGPFTVIDDCYNANPLSMHRAMQRVSERAGTRPLILILGEMKELGSQAESRHEQLGGWAVEAGAAHVFFYGEHRQAVQRGLGRYDAGRFHILNDDEERFLQEWRSLGLDCGVVLVKGSRGCALERFVNLLHQELAP